VIRKARIASAAIMSSMAQTGGNTKFKSTPEFGQCRKHYNELIGNAKKSKTNNICSQVLCVDSQIRYRREEIQEGTRNISKLPHGAMMCVSSLFVRN
jgi:hypothetical protein